MGISSRLDARRGAFKGTEWSGSLLIAAGGLMLTPLVMVVVRVTRSSRLLHAPERACEACGALWFMPGQPRASCLPELSRAEAELEAGGKGAGERDSKFSHFGGNCRSVCRLRHRDGLCLVSRKSHREGLVVFGGVAIAIVWLVWKLAKMWDRSRRVTGLLNRAKTLDVARKCAGEAGTVIDAGSSRSGIPARRNPVPMLLEELAARRRLEGLLGKFGHWFLNRPCTFSRFTIERPSRSSTRRCFVASISADTWVSTFGSHGRSCCCALARCRAGLMMPAPRPAVSFRHFCLNRTYRHSRRRGLRQGSRVHAPQDTTFRRDPAEPSNRWLA